MDTVSSKGIHWSPHGGITRTWPVDRLFAAVAEAGYAGIEVLVAEDWLDWKDPTDVERVRGLLRAHDLVCPAVCWRGNQGPRMITSPGNEESARAYLVDCIDLATRLDAGAVLVWPRIAPGVERPVALATAARVLTGVGDLCRRSGVIISLEFESVGDPLCGTPAETIELIEQTGDFLTICCDTFHLYNRGLDPYTSVLPQRGRIGLVHLSDAGREPPGDRDFDFGRFIQAVVDVDYRGPVFVQIDPRAEGDLARARLRAAELTAPLSR